MIIKFYENFEDSKIKFAVIIALYDGKFVLCKHKNRDSFEFPGGHREIGENIFTTAERELHEETGAIRFSLDEVSVYSVEGKDGIIETDKETFGKLFCANITEFENTIQSEIEKIEFFESVPCFNLTYPVIHSALLEKYKNFIKK